MLGQLGVGRKGVDHVHLLRREPAVADTLLQSRNGLKVLCKTFFHKRQAVSALDEANRAAEPQFIGDVHHLGEGADTIALRRLGAYSHYIGVVEAERL